jgi:hypothetical protein
VHAATRASSLKSVQERARNLLYLQRQRYVHTSNELKLFRLDSALPRTKPEALSAAAQPLQLEQVLARAEYVSQTRVWSCIGRKSAKTTHRNEGAYRGSLLTGKCCQEAEQFNPMHASATVMRMRNAASLLRMPVVGFGKLTHQARGDRLEHTRQVH